MLTPFHGGFLLHPCPLELSFNYCSHACSFCFANHAAPNRETGITSLSNLLADYQNRTTLTARLLQAGYPVLVSNRVDPFAASNYQQAVPTLRTMTDLGIPYTIASRGGVGVDEVLSFAPRLVWYLSVNQDDDDLRKRIEPGAPTLDSRLQLAQKLVKRGDLVHLAINPYVPGWWRDFPRSLQPYRDLGITHAFLQMLHLNYRQEAELSAREKAAMGLDVIAEAKRKADLRDETALMAADAALIDMGFDVHNYHVSRRDGVYESFRSVYPKTFPIIDDYLNWVQANITDSAPVCRFEEFWRCLSPMLPVGTFSGVRDYLSVSNRKYCVEHQVPQTGTFRDVLKVIWGEPTMPCSPAGMDCFPYAGHVEKPQSTVFYDAGQLPYLYYRGSSAVPVGDIVEASEFFE